MTVPSLEEVDQLDDEATLALEEKLLQQSDNSPRPEDGNQPPQDEDSVLDVTP